jgi:Magnesium transporter NIPA
VCRIGIALAVSSGMLIGSSFVFKKKGLLSSQKGKVAGEGIAYLKSVSVVVPCSDSETNHLSQRPCGGPG